MRSSKVVIVLAHLMNKSAILNLESKKRIELAVSLFREKKYDFIITTGWNYRKDTQEKIGNIQALHIIKNYDIPKEKIIVDTNARDTVGDAYFIRKKLNKLMISNIIVVTSDYHVKRTKLIFKSFFNNINIRVYGCKTNSKHLSKEESSIKAFIKTFEKVNIQSDGDVYKKLRQGHPFYNGDIYEKI